MAFAKAAEYFDLGSFQAWLFMDWSTGSVNTQALYSYLDSFADQLLEQKLSHVILSFGQVSDISKMSQNDFSELSRNNAFGMMYTSLNKSNANVSLVINTMIGRWLAKGVTTGIAFGGINASNSDWYFGFSSNSTDLSEELVNWAKNIGFVQLDFDVENTTFSQNNPQDLSSFFENLKENFVQGAVTLTVMGSIGDWGLESAVFSPMFTKAKFQDLFDGINLMLYNGQYYLNAGQLPLQSWDIISWLNQLKSNSGMSGSDAARYINIGFNAKIDYTLASSSAGPLVYKTLPAGISSGGAAAYIYEQLEKGTGSSLGSCFFWDENADYTVSPTNNYVSMFFNNTGDFERDFFTY